jgi:hypothetical protein
MEIRNYITTDFKAIDSQETDWDFFDDFLLKKAST